MKNRTHRVVVTALFSMVATIPFAHSAEPSSTDTLNDWLNKEVNEVLARMDMRQDTRQTETPSTQENSTSLVDKSSASALVGAAINVAGLSTETQGSEKADSFSVTASAYSLLAAYHRKDPLDPVFYNAHPNWRRVSITMGYDNPQDSDSSSTAEQTKIAGLKYLFLNQRDPALHKEEIDALLTSTAAAGTAFGKLTAQISHTIQMELFGTSLRDRLRTKKKDSSSQDEIKAFDALLSMTDLESRIKYDAEGLISSTPNDAIILPIMAEIKHEFELAGGFERAWNALSDESRTSIRNIIAGENKVFENLEKETRDKIAEFLRKPQVSFSALSKRRADGPDEYELAFIVDYGVADKINFTANATYQYIDSKLPGADKRGGSAAFNFDFLASDAGSRGKDPLKFSLAGTGDWMTDTDATYKAQAKLTLPISDGIVFPISVTYASRTDLIDEHTVRGQLGFTFDTARLLSAFGGH